MRGPARAAAALCMALIATAVAGCAGPGAQVPPPSATSEPPPDPTRAVLVITRGDWNHFVEIGLDGTTCASQRSEIETLTPRFAGLARPMLSPDATKIAYMLDPDVNSTIPEPSLHVFDIASREDATLASGSGIFACSWTPDGDPIASLYRLPRPMEEPGPLTQRRLVRFDLAEDTATVLARVPDADDWGGEVGPGALSVVAGDDEWLYLIEGWVDRLREPSAKIGIQGIWRVPAKGGDLQPLARFPETFETAVKLAGEDLHVAPVCAVGALTHGRLSPDDGIEIEFRYQTGCGMWHGSTEATIAFPVRTHRLRDGEILAEESRVQTFTPGDSTAPPPGEHVVSVVHDPYFEDRRLEDRMRYVPEPARTLYEVAGGLESVITTTAPATRFETGARPLCYLPGGDFLYLSSSGAGQRIVRFRRDAGRGEPLATLAGPEEDPWHISLLGMY